MKKTGIRLTVVFILLIDSLGISAQTQHDSMLNTLMQQEKWFDVQVYLSQNRDSISEMYYLVAKSFLDTYFNRPESSLTHIGALLNKYSKELGGTFDFAILMMKNLAEVQKYDEAINILNEILRQTGDALPQEWKDNLNMALSGFESVKERPTQIIFSENDQSKIPFEMQLAGIGVNSKVNGVDLQAIFDTGSSINRMSKETADRMGIHSYLPDTIYADNVRFLRGIIDSIEIGNIKIYNLLANVALERPNLPVSQEAKEIVFSFVDSALNNNVLLGIETIKKIDIINVDFINKYISFEEATSEIQQLGNIFIIDNRIYLQTLLNNQPFTSIFDTGYSVGTFLNKDYYERYRAYFSFKDEQQHIDRSFYNDALDTIEYKNLNDIVLTNYNNRFNFSNVMVAINRPFTYTDNYPVLDGIIGNDFLKLLKNMRLDFKNMCITFE